MPSIPDVWPLLPPAFLTCWLVLNKEAERLENTSSPFGFCSCPQDLGNAFLKGVQDEGRNLQADCPSLRSKRCASTTWPVCLSEHVPTPSQDWPSCQAAMPLQGRRQPVLLAPGPMLGQPSYITVERDVPSSELSIWKILWPPSLSFLTCWTGKLRAHQSSSSLPCFSASLITRAAWGWHGPGCQELNERPWTLDHWTTLVLPPKVLISPPLPGTPTCLWKQRGGQVRCHIHRNVFNKILVENGSHKRLLAHGFATTVLRSGPSGKTSVPISNANSSSNIILNDIQPPAQFGSTMILTNSGRQTERLWAWGPKQRIKREGKERGRKMNSAEKWGGLWN